MKSLIYSILILFLSYCSPNSAKKPVAIDVKAQVKDTFKIFTQRSNQKNTSQGFNSPNAINKIASIENEYFNAYQNSQSKYYGTQWYQKANETITVPDSVTLFDKYKQSILERAVKPDSMHCTIYAIEALKAGFGNEFKQIEKHHKQIWKKREYAGWSIAYILTEKYNWKAYLVLSNQSKEYKACLRNYKKDGKYHVWYQPDIKIEKVFNIDKDKIAIDSLLSMNEFGWGFSEQGWHTWITRHKQLKECNWLGVPAKMYNNGEKPLFISTKFTEFTDYNSHIIVFPPKIKELE